MNDMKRFARNLKQTVIENPIPTILVAAVAVTAAAKLIDSIGGAVGSAAYAKQVALRAAKAAKS